ncbi:riboflavin synthase [Dactylosporangium sp. CA-233914]|uniref:riboflavin synthase n=1 Tax=Dactylosporangium sp. CA-233914 TaxID=3239934 RepID=UPI003D8D24B7
MFTGIIEELGTVVAIDELGDSARLSIRGATVASDAAHGDSISVNGVCLTVVDNADGVFTADVMGETLKRSALGSLRAGSAVNLERAATVATRLGGHIVQGHVDGVGQILSREAGDQWETVTFSLPAELGRYVVEKGSITVDGISLTVMAVTDDTVGPPPRSARFSVGLIPTTLKLTTLGAKGVGERVNLEVDIMAKYVEKLLAKAPRS